MCVCAYTYSRKKKRERDRETERVRKKEPKEEEINKSLRKSDRERKIVRETSFYGGSLFDSEFNAVIRNYGALEWKTQ